MGTFTRKIARQPHRETRNPLSTGPAAALAVSTMEIVAITRGGGRPSSPAIAACTIAIPAGIVAQLPNACSNRTATSAGNVGANAASTPVTAIVTSPAQKTSRGPSRSASVPISGGTRMPVR
jgi:hypothetical protein